VRDDIIYLSHGGPILTPDDAAHVNAQTDCVGFDGASSLERIGVEQSLIDITKRFKAIPGKLRPG
jgi:predicted TIM-barrel enzyme